MNYKSEILYGGGEMSSSVLFGEDTTYCVIGGEVIMDVGEATRGLMKE
jgi:hypothetical protein